MKKKVFLTMLTCIVLCVVLAIYAGAATTNEFGTVEKSNTIDLTDMSTDETARVVLYDGTEYHTYPARYIVKNSTSFSLDFTRVNTAFTKEYGKNSIIRIEIPINVIKITTQLNGGKNSNYGQALVEVVFPKNTAVTTFEWGCFEACSKLESIVIPGTLTTYNGQNHFAKCTSLKEVTFGEGYNVSYIPLNCFQSCSSLEYIKFPNCVTEIRGGAFASCSKLKTIIFGDSLQTMGGPMSDCSTSGSVWYLPASFYSSSVTSTPPSNMFHWAGDQTNGVSGTSNNPKNITFVYTGTKAEAEALQARFKTADATTGENCIGLSRIYNATLCTEAEYEQLTGKKVGEIATGYYIVYGYNKCKAFYENKHNYGDVNSCTDDAKCERNCGYAVQSQFTGHKIVKKMEYANGFGKNGVYNCICENAEYCTVIDGYALNETKNPIITFKGYSVPEKENSLAINVGYEIDYTLLIKYEEVTGEEVKLSLFMVNSQTKDNEQNKVNISAIFKNEALDFADGVNGFCVQVNKSSYNSVSLTIKGFDKGENYNGSYYALRLISAIIVQTTKDAVTSTHYVQATLDTTDKITLDNFDFVIITASAVYKDPIPTV